QVPLVGAVKVGGLTVAAASSLIEKKLGEKYLKSPQVAINVMAQFDKLVSVEGQVTKAGAYPVMPDTRLLTAISLAQSP
ncbi:polysaccharide biosynthesis/export family protein, partial [Acinetobacter baumannii]